MTNLSNTEHWTCPNCSERVEPQFSQCWKCETPIPSDFAAKYRNATDDVEESTDASDNAVEASVASNLGWSVWAFVLFPPLGLMALICSVLAEISRINDQTAMFQDYSRRAADWRLGAHAMWVVLMLVAGFIAAALVRVQ